MQAVFVTWLPFAHSRYHSQDFYPDSPPQEGSQAPASGLSSECFVCAASLGAGTPATPGLALSTLVAWTPPPPLVPSPLLQPSCFHPYEARAPPAPTA